MNDHDDSKSQAPTSHSSRPWRSLDELEPSPIDEPRHEFPPPPSTDGFEFTRRAWLEGAAAGLAMAGCARDRQDKILGYTTQPVDVVPGRPRHFATSMEIDGLGTGLIVETHEGRPTKIEGNPDHPSSLGATSPFEQAWILDLYDPDRAKSVRERGGAASWQGFVARFSAPRADRGAGLRFLCDPTSSSLIHELVAAVRRRHPESRVTWMPARSDAVRDGARIAFGSDVCPQWDLSHARTLLALDWDMADASPGMLPLSRQIADGRRHRDRMNRLYVVEPALTPTGTLADHRIRRTLEGVCSFSRAVVAALAAELPSSAEGSSSLLARVRALDIAPDDRALSEVIARDLVNARGAAVILPGPRLPADVHALVHLANAWLGSRHSYAIDPPIPVDPSALGLEALRAELERGAVDTLVVLAHNPVYSAPGDLDLGRHFQRAREVVYLASHENETATLASWVVPAAHGLETWGDLRAHDGTSSVIQPLIEPLFGGKSVAEVLAVFSGDAASSPNDLVRGWFRRAYGPGDSDRFGEALRRGIVSSTAFLRRQVELDDRALLGALERETHRKRPEARAIEVAFEARSKVFDGRYANNPWLQELPCPMTKITWGNAAALSPATAKRLGLATGDVVTFVLDERDATGPVVIAPGHADDAFTIPLGYGRKGEERIARDVGFSAAPLRRAMSPWSAHGVVLRKTGRREDLALTQRHHGLFGRDIVKVISTNESEAPESSREAEASLYTPFPAGTGQQWAMSIDLSACSGCSACMVACQAENNVMTVGKENVLVAREMHWIRIDTYFTGPAEEPRAVNQPMLCQHCEKAPCEYVCPVNATEHSPDGLNEMVYNRCIGTRFCSNNCPYKVRRFNWFHWSRAAQGNDGLIRLQRNPEVTVRDRGVMEKCTYCVQRIRTTELRARVEGRSVADGEITPACAQACPTRAIVFGSIADHASAVSRAHADARSFAVLAELGTVPRTRYLAKIENPNPELRR